MVGEARTTRVRGCVCGLWAAARLGMAILALVAPAGCSTGPVPSRELTAADLAVARARTAGAAHYASAELALAEAKLEAADAAIQAKAHERARILAEQAMVDAELAEAKAEAVQAQAATRRLREGLEARNRRLTPAEDGV